MRSRFPSAEWSRRSADSCGGYVCQLSYIPTARHLRPTSRIAAAQTIRARTEAEFDRNSPRAPQHDAITRAAGEPRHARAHYPRTPTRYRVVCR